MWFHLYENIVQTKTLVKDCQWLPYTEDTLTTKRHKGIFLSDGNDLYLDYGGVCIGLHLKSSYCILCKLRLHKIDFLK